MKTKILTFLAFTAVATLSCNRYGSETHPFDNTVFMDVSSVRQDQATTFGNNIEGFTREITAQFRRVLFRSRSPIQPKRT